MEARDYNLKLIDEASSVTCQRANSIRPEWGLNGLRVRLQCFQRLVDQSAAQFLLRFSIEIRVTDDMHDAIAQYETIRAHHFSDG